MLGEQTRVELLKSPVNMKTSMKRQLCQKQFSVFAQFVENMKRNYLTKNDRMLLQPLAMIASDRRKTPFRANKYMCPSVQLRLIYYKDNDLT